MKTTRSFQFLCRLKLWQLYNGTWIRQQPIFCFDHEVSVEEAKRRYGFEAHPSAIGVKVFVTTWEPCEVEVDPS